MRNVNSYGEGFGMYDDAWRCTVNGRCSVIDARFNLYRAESTHSAWHVPVSHPCEGVAFTGFARLSAGTAASDAAASRAVDVVLTGQVQGQLSLVCVLYEPT